MQAFRKIILCVLLCALLLSGCSRSAAEQKAASEEWFSQVIYSKEEPAVEEHSKENVIHLEELEETAGKLVPEAGQGYYLEQLSPPEQIWYGEISTALQDFADKWELSAEGLEAGLTEADVDRIFQCVLNDHPEYFYVEGYSYVTHMLGTELQKLEFTGTYSITEEEVGRRQAEIDAQAAVILAQLPAAAGEYEKIKHIYEAVILGTDYDLSAQDNQNIYSVLVGRRSVCQGYAKAVQYLLQKAGVECTLVTGTVDGGEGHAWNLVKCNGQYYYVDATWGDVSYESGGRTEVEQPPVSYDYLCITTQQLLRTHQISEEFQMPLCDSLTDHYFVREGAYFTAVEDAQLKKVFAGAAEAGRQDVTLKCADTAVYREMVRLLVEQQGIFDYMECETGEIAYAENDRQLSVTFWVTNK